MKRYGSEGSPNRRASATKKHPLRFLLGTVFILTMILVTPPIYMLGQQQASGDVLFILDTSKSMEELGDKAKGLSRLEVAREAFGEVMGKAVKHAGANGQFAALVLGRIDDKGNKCVVKMEIDWAKASVNRKKIEWLMGVKGAQKFDEIQQLKPEGKTPLAEALQKARANLAQQKVANPAIVLISDGLQTCGANPTKALRDAAEALANDAQIKNKLNGVYILYFIPVNTPKAGTQDATNLNKTLDELQEVGKKLGAKMIALVNTFQGFKELLEGAIIDGVNPAKELGRLHASKDLDDLQIAVYMKDTTGPGGNPDGKISPGETVQIGFRVLNNSNATIEDLKFEAIKTNLGEKVKPSTQNIELGNLDPGKQLLHPKDAQNALTVTVDNDVKEGTVFRLGLGVKAKDIPSKNLEFSFKIGSLLTPTQRASEIRLEFANGKTTRTAAPNSTVTIHINGPSGTVYYLMFSVEKGGSTCWGVELELGGRANAVKQGKLGNVTEKFQFKIPDYLPVEEKEIYFQAVNKITEDQYEASNVITIKIDR